MAAGGEVVGDVAGVVVEGVGDVVGVVVEGVGDVSSHELGVVSIVLCQPLQVTNFSYLGNYPV